mgnify:CR=1 FL=1
MDQNLHFAHAIFGTQFSEHRQGSLKVFHSTLTVGCYAPESSQQLADLHSKVVGFSHPPPDLNADATEAFAEGLLDHKRR